MKGEEVLLDTENAPGLNRYFIMREIAGSKKQLFRYVESDM